MARSSSRSAPARPRAVQRAPPPAAPSTRQQQAPPPAPHHAAPAPQPSSGGGGMLSGLGSTIAQGFAFGTGSALAREAVGGVMGAFGGSEKPSPSTQSQPQATRPSASASNGPCEMDSQAFRQCLESNPSNASSCDFYYTALQACQQNNASF